MTVTQQAIAAFLEGLDATDRSRLKAVIMGAYDEHANSFPGPDALVKKTVRPHVEKFAESLVNDLTRWEL